MASAPGLTNNTIVNYQVGGWAHSTETFRVLSPRVICVFAMASPKHLVRTPVLGASVKATSLSAHSCGKPLCTAQPLWCSVLPAGLRRDLVTCKSLPLHAGLTRHRPQQPQTCPHTNGKWQQVRTPNTWRPKAEPQIWMLGSRAPTTPWVSKRNLVRNPYREHIQKGVAGKICGIRAFGCFACRSRTSWTPHTRRICMAGDTQGLDSQQFSSGREREAGTASGQAPLLALPG